MIAALNAVARAARAARAVAQAATAARAVAQANAAAQAVGAAQKKRNYDRAGPAGRARMDQADQDKEDDEQTAAGAKKGVGSGAAAGAAVGGVAGAVVGAGVEAFGKIKDYGVQMFAQVATKVLSYFDPMRLIGAALVAQSGGSQQADKAFGLLANTVGSVLMPVFLTIGAVLLTVAGRIQGPLLEAVDDLMEYGFEHLEDAADATATALTHLRLMAMIAAEVMRRITGGKDESTESRLLSGPITRGPDGKLRAGQRVRTKRAAGGKTPAAGKPGEPGKGGEGGRAGQAGESGRGGDGGPAGKPGDPGKGGEGGRAAGPPEKWNAREGMGDELRDNLHKMLLAYRQGNTPPARDTNLLDLNKNLQLAALNQNPIEVENQKLMQQLLGRVDQYLARLDAPRPKSGGM